MEDYNDKNIDSVRGLVRAIRHSMGSKTAADSKLFAEKFHDFLDPDIYEYEPFVIPETVTRLGILNDIHFPYQDKQNLSAAIDFLKKKEVNGILLNGDIIPEVTDNTAWGNLVTGALCAYENNWNYVGRTKPDYYE
jgi:hypothetical protein